MGGSRWVRVLLAAMLVFVAAACGSDDPEASTEDVTTTTKADEDSNDEDSDADDDASDAAAAFADEDCQFYLKALATSPLQNTSGEDVDYEDVGKQFQAIADKAPDELQDDFETLGEFYEDYGPLFQKLADNGGQPTADLIDEYQELGQKLADSEFVQASTNISTYFTENCTNSG